MREDWRRLDLVSGRLDGASKLIQTLLPSEDAPQSANQDGDSHAEPLSNRLIREAHQAILAEEYAPGGVLYELTRQLPPPIGADLRDAFRDLRRATNTEFDNAEWVRHGNRVTPFLRAALREGLPWWSGRPASGLVAVSWSVARGVVVAANARDRASEIAAKARSQMGDGANKIKGLPAAFLRRRGRSRAASRSVSAA